MASPERTLLDREDLGEMLDFDERDGTVHEREKACGFQQRNSWRSAPSTRSSRGCSPSQRDVTCGQRTAKGHPSTFRVRSGGRPGITCRCETRRPVGIDRIKPCVYGCRGSSNSCSVGAISTISPAYMT